MSVKPITAHEVTLLHYVDYGWSQPNFSSRILRGKRTVDVMRRLLALREVERERSKDGRVWLYRRIGSQRRWAMEHGGDGQ